MEYPRTRRPSVDDRDHFLRKSIKNSFFFKYFYENVSTMRPTGTGSVPEDTDAKKKLLDATTHFRFRGRKIREMKS